MKVEEDLRMAASNSSDVVDLILGGHDHIYMSELNYDSNIFVQKSGSDFKEFSNLTILFDVESSTAL